MLVYRNQAKSINTLNKLAHVGALIAELERGKWDHERALELLIEFGELEAGIADALSPQKDGVQPTERAFREASLLLGHAYFHSWRDTGAAPAWLSKFARAFRSLFVHDLPERIAVSVPEGYAYYSLYPEMYLEAVEQFFEGRHPQHAVVIGIRSIGTSESSVVGATLEELGCAVHSYTVRPRGHPFDRHLAVDAALAKEWRAHGDRFFLVVDEGPGLSGSSFISVTQELAALGIPDERIALFPSWLPEETHFVSATARAHWHRYDKYVATFEQVELESGKLGPGPGKYADLSAGQWRSFVYADISQYPAVHPHHERRKFLQLAIDAGTPDLAHGAVLFKFEGLGRYGRVRRERAEQLAEAGLAPRLLGLQNGFLATEWVPGHSLVLSDKKRDVLDALARYLGFLEEKFPAPPGVGFDELIEMIRVNVSEGLGEKWRAQLTPLSRYSSIISDAGTTALDARMLPHEWLAASGQFIKTDGLDHHDDHFYPGCQNVAWDLAGACVEFDLTREERMYLLDQYRRRTRDRNVEDRLPFYLIAYLAFRLGYASMASQALASSFEGERFQKLFHRYAKRLQQEIRRLVKPA